MDDQGGEEPSVPCFRGIFFISLNLSTAEKISNLPSPALGASFLSALDDEYRQELLLPSPALGASFL